MPRTRPSQHADFEGWDVTDMFAAILIELQKMNARAAGVAEPFITDPDATPADLAEAAFNAGAVELEALPEAQRMKLSQVVAAQKVDIAAKKAKAASKNK